MEQPGTASFICLFYENPNGRGGGIFFSDLGIFLFLILLPDTQRRQSQGQLSQTKGKVEVADMP